MDKEPASSVHEGSRVSAGKITVSTCLHTVDFHLTRRKKINAGHRLVANSHLTFESVDVESLESTEVFEKCAIGRSHGKLDARKLWHN